MIGIALDGNIVLGPYNFEGELWDTNEHDFCNTVVLADGSYAYVTTTYPPYTVGCWGAVNSYDSAIYLSTFTAAVIAMLY